MGTVQRIVAQDAVSGHPYTLAVAVANPANVEQLMRTAVDLADARDGQIRVVSVAHKPATSPFVLFSEDSLQGEFTGDQEAVLDRAVAAAADATVPVRRSLLVGTDVSTALLSEVRTVDADALLLGWKGESHPADAVLGRTVDPVVRRAPCDVYVERVGRTADGMDAILLPTDGGPHVEPATELAAAIARSNDATVRVVSYVTPAADETERAAARDHVDGATDHLADVAVHAEVREADVVADAIVAAADAHDLVVLGATRESRFRGRVVGSVAAAVGRRAVPPIVIAKRGVDGPRLGRRFGASLLQRALGRW